MSLIINDDNLQLNEINEFSSKVRAILMDEEKRVLIANYGGIILFPGGSIDNDESTNEAIIRELTEETGTLYKKEDLEFLTELNFFQKNYVKRDGRVLNRLIKTYYFRGTYKKGSLKLQHLTEKEKNDKFRLELIPLIKLKTHVLKNLNDNPRNIYFQKEMLEVIDLFLDKLS